MMATMDNVPSVPPPPGVTSNFDDPETRAPLFRGIVILCIVLVWPIFLVRLYTKAWITRAFGLDDVASILAVLSTTTLASFLLWGTSPTHL